MTTKLDDISEAIGALRNEVKNLGQKIDRADQNAAESNRQAAEHHAALHRRVDELVVEVGEVKADTSGLAGTVAQMQATVADSKSVTDEVKMWKAQGRGALFVVGIASAAISSTAVAFLSYWWEAIMRLLRSG